MDDFNFDHKIKEKLDHYEDPSFDESAFVDFQEKLSSWKPSGALKVRTNHYYYLAASLLLFTLVNAYLFWPAKIIPTFGESSQINKQEYVIDSLQLIIQQFITANQRALINTDHTLLSHQDTQNINVTDHQNTYDVSADKISLGNIDRLPAKLISILKEAGMLTTEGEHAFLIPPNDSLFLIDQKIYNHYKWADRLTPMSSLTIPQYQIKTIYVNSSAISQTAKKNQLSAKKRNELEKHYSPGLGINIAPHLDLSQGFFSDAHGAITPRAGIVVDWILSPRWSILSGLDYSTTKFRLDGDQKSISIPNYDASLGEIEHMDIKSTLASLPVSIKYRQWIGEKTQGFLTIGYTPYYSFKTEYKFEHDFGKAYDPTSPKVNSVQQNSTTGFYAGTGTFSIGLTKRIKNNTKIEGALYYERNISAGQEKLNMQLLGLRTAYWFKLR